MTCGVRGAFRRRVDGCSLVRARHVSPAGCMHSSPRPHPLSLSLPVPRSWSYLQFLELAAAETDPVARMKLLVTFSIAGLRQQISFGARRARFGAPGFGGPGVRRGARRRADPLPLPPGSLRAQASPSTPSWARPSRASTTTGPRCSSSRSATTRPSPPGSSTGMMTG